MTTTDGGAGASESFGDTLHECVESLEKLVPDLSGRYSRAVIVGAMAEHVGWAYQMLVRTERCSAQQIRDLIRGVEEWAFHCPVPPVDAPKPDSTH